MERHEIQEAIEEAISSVFQKRDEQSNLSRDIHSEHHAWLAARIAEEEKRARFWETMRNKTLPWLIAAIMTWAGTQIWTQVTTFAKEHWK